ncbi:zinc finger MYM-type protein 1, partial [Rosa sericea]
IRRPICKYPLNERDNIRRAYVVLGPYQPHLSFYPLSFDGGQCRKFNPRWFKEWPWLEYSAELDKAFCFPCFLFDRYPSHHPAFTEHGFQGWKNVMSKKSGIVFHMGGINSPHNIAMQKWESLRNPSKHIERVISTQSSQEVADNRLRLITTIESVRLLARQGCAFRGHDESVNSSNGGNFNAVVDSFGRMNIDVRRVFQNAPGNAKYISPLIQKQILNILGNKVRIKIREEVGDAKFCILVDEAVDVSNREQMAIILRFVDCDGFIRERFFKVLSVADTCSQTLKDEISKVLTQYDLQVENMRGQGYDGASNMRGEFNGLQALFREECPYAYYVHCFAHRLQLTLNTAAKGVHDIWEFFSTLSLIVNFVDSSAKRHSALRVIREEEIADLVAAGALETGRGANQTSTLQRAGATRWGSHLRSISSLIKLFGATQTTLANLVANGPNKVQGEAKSVGNAMKRFDFVFCLLLMHDVMKITDFLCQSLQKKAIDILNALNFLSITKSKLQDMREDGWDDLIMRVEAFCCEYDIEMPDMSSPYKKSTRACEQNITNEHYYRVNILNAVIDFQLAELDSRFTDNSLELLILSATFDPRDNFRSFKCEDVCNLALRFYPHDFTSYDMLALDMECGYFLADIQRDPRFANTTTVSDLCRRLVESRKSAFFPMIYRLICLVLTLPVSTATTERAFSSMTIIKSKLRNKMEDEFFDDLMVVYIEKEFADSIDNDSVIAEFEVSGSRR